MDKNTIDLIYLRRYLDKFDLRSNHIENNIISIPYDKNKLRSFDNKITRNKVLDREDIYFNQDQVQYEQIHTILPNNYQFSELDSITIINSKLSTFNGFPSKINLDCNVKNNYLKSFKDSPSIISGKFNVEDNNIINFYHLSGDIRLGFLSCKGNPIYNIYYILMNVFDQATFNSYGLIDLFNDYNCWQKSGSGMKVDGENFKDILSLNNCNSKIEWIDYQLTWCKDANHKYNITKISDDPERIGAYQVKWDVLHHLSNRKYENVSGFVKISNLYRPTIYIPSIYQFVFSIE